MKRYGLLADVATDADIEAAFEWYESEQPGLGLEFLDELEPFTHAFSTGLLSIKSFDPGSGGRSRDDFHMRFISL